MFRPSLYSPLQSPLVLGGVLDGLRLRALLVLEEVRPFGLRGLGFMVQGLGFMVYTV